MGKPLSGTAFFGYKWENREYMIDEKEAPVRKLMFELFLKHKRKRTILGSRFSVGKYCGYERKIH
jgi:site-specific DNA recombinase